MSALTTIPELDLLHWRRTVFELYADVRAGGVGEAQWRAWRERRDALVGGHPCSPLDVDRRRGFEALGYHPYDPGLRVTAEVERADGAEVEIGTSTGEPYRFARFGRARFALNGRPQRLTLFWLAGYGGGVFLPFADATNGVSTYGAGRYLLDTVKGADLGEEDGRLVLDFNFAYNPSCSYDPRWTCPLPPPENRLADAVVGGEVAYDG